MWNLIKAIKNNNKKETTIEEILIDITKSKRPWDIEYSEAKAVADKYGKGDEKIKQYGDKHAIIVFEIISNHIRRMETKDVQVLYLQRLINNYKVLKDPSFYIYFSSLCLSVAGCVSNIGALFASLNQEDLALSLVSPVWLFLLLGVVSVYCVGLLCNKSKNSFCINILQWVLEKAKKGEYR